MLKIGIITGSTRDARVNLQVAQWIEEIAKNRTGVSFELIDIKDYNLPSFNESVPAIMNASGNYQHQEVKDWSDKIKEMDGFIFVTPEYNRGITSALKDAIDYLYPEWINKAAGIVSYGSSGGVSAATQLRVILSTPQIATVQSQPVLNLFTDFEEMRTFKPAPFHQETILTMIDQVIDWSTALKTIRP